MDVAEIILQISTLRHPLSSFTSVASKGRNGQFESIETTVSTKPSTGLLDLSQPQGREHRLTNII